MDDIKKCGQTEALKMLHKGAFVFTEIKNDIIEERTGCRKCNTARKGKFCSECGSKITDKLKVVVGQDLTQFRLKYSGDILYMETRKSKKDFYSNRRKCNFSLEFFLKQQHWGWIW